MKILISQIPARMEETELKKLFVEYGQVASVKIFRSNLKTNNGYVNMPVYEQMLKAVSRLNGIDIMGSTLMIAIEEYKQNGTH